VRIGLDIETSLDHKTIWLVKTIDIDSGEVRTWNNPDGLQAYIEASTLVTGQNIVAFDSRVLMNCWKMKIPLRKMSDTLILSKLLKPNREGGHSLAAWGERLGTKKTEYSKIWEWIADRRQEYDGECFDRPFMPLLSYYCEQDVRVLRVLFLHLEAEWKASGFSQESFELEHEVAQIIAEQEQNGFKFDLPYATCLLADLKGKLAEIDDAMQRKWPPVYFKRYHKTSGKELKDGCITFNVGSRQQVAEKLKELGWKPVKFTEKGSPILDEDVLTSIEIPEAKLIVDYFKYKKIIGFVEGWFSKVDPDGRVRGRVDPLGAATGRMTHSSPNMANIPAVGTDDDGNVLEGLEGGYGAECRECWTVEEGNVLVGADASGLELRMLAHYMGDEAYTKAVVSGKSSEGTDIHSVNTRAAGLPSRKAGKRFIYAYLYGGGDALIGGIVGGGAEEGKAIKAKFLAQTPALANLKKRLEKSCERGYVMGLDGRKIWIASDHSALNYLLQGGGAIVMKKALVLFYRKVQANGWPVKLTVNVHDEQQWETVPAFAEITGRAFVESIREAGTHFNLKCPLDGEFKYGQSWRETH
jgi:DNA polymerase-1